MLPLLIALALAVPGEKDCPRVGERCDPFTGRSKAGGAFLEFAPASGAGMGTACACSTVTGAKGETLAFARTSSATCTKTATGGFATSGIADGDLVSCSSGQPRVEYDSAGVLGLLVESSRQNTILRSQEIDNAAWGNSTASVALPTLNGADAVVAPDGTTTAEDYSFPSIAGAAYYSYRYQSNGCPLGATSTLSVYAKSISGGTTIDLTIQTGAASWSSTTCTVSTSAWTRCLLTATTGASDSTAYVGIGQVGVSTTRSAARVALWGVQCEAGAYATSYIPTVAAAATRQTETGYLPLTGLSAPDPLCIAASLNGEWGTAAAPATSSFASVTYSTTDYFMLYGNTNHNNCVAQITQGGAPQRTSTTTAATTWTQARCYTDNAGTTTNVTHVGGNSATSSTGSAATWAPQRVYIGGLNLSTTMPNGIVSRVIVGTDSTRCR